MFDRSGLPKEVTVYEVGPRDGLQNEALVLPTTLKLQLVKRLIRSGVPAIEVACSLCSLRPPGAPTSRSGKARPSALRRN